MPSLSELNGSNGFILNGIASGNGDGDLSGWSVSDAGDVNGDGFDDLIIGAYGAGPDGKLAAGESYVVFGSGAGFAADLDLASLDGSNGFTLNGVDAEDLSGHSVSGAGDVNGDGYDDLIVGAYAAADTAGESYVVFGSGAGFAASLDLASLNGSNGFALNGIVSEDNSGYSVSGAGDVNGDGYDDLIVGAYAAAGTAGESYVVFGSGAGFAASLDLAGLDGSNGFTLNGIDGGGDTGGGSGWSVSDAGDVNGDGYDDLIIGAFYASPDGKLAAGESYVVFGSGAGFAAGLDLASLDGSNGFTLNGIDEFDQSGHSVSGAGDVNGDGYDDLIIGAYVAADTAGESYVVFGSGAGFGTSLDLAGLDGSNGFTLNGVDAEDFSGYSVSGAGDVNGDGYDDLIIGAIGGDNYAGESYVVFGSGAGFAASLDLASLDGSNGFTLNGIDPDDYSGFSVSDAGDVNGDGYDDLIIGASGADPDGNSSAGESYVVFGGPDGLLAPANSAPVFVDLPEVMNADELTTISFDIAATDADGDAIALGAELIRPNGTPGNTNRYSFTDNGDGTGTFTWRIPERFVDVDYTLRVTADDGVNAPVEDSFIIAVADTNAPVINPVADQIVDERSSIGIDVTAYDPDGDAIILDAVLYRPNGLLAKPERYSFTDNGDGTGSFEWNTPVREADGDYTLQIIADDGSNNPVISESIITVLDVDVIV